jgi:hypothetical protein
MALIYPAVAAGLLMLAAWLANAPVRPGRLDRFHRLHRVGATPDERPLVEAYLGHTRRADLGGRRRADRLAGHRGGPDRPSAGVGAGPGRRDAPGQRQRGRVPYPAASVHASVTLRFTDVDRFDADGTYHLVVIDKRSNTVAPSLYRPDGRGSDGVLGHVPARYPWLSALASIPVNGGWTDPGTALIVPSGSPGPIGFTGSFTGTGLTPDDLMVALIFTGPDRQIYWADRVSG